MSLRPRWAIGRISGVRRSKRIAVTIGVLSGRAPGAAGTSVAGAPAAGGAAGAVGTGEALTGRLAPSCTRDTDASCCRLPSSDSSNSSGRRSSTGCPFRSTTVTSINTPVVVVRVTGGCWASGADAAARRSAETSADFIGDAPHERRCRLEVLLRAFYCRLLRGVGRERILQGRPRPAAGRFPALRTGFALTRTACGRRFCERRETGGVKRCDHATKRLLLAW